MENVLDRWVAALRSGDYTQGRGALNRYGQLCCLGVLCEIAVADGIVERVSAVMPDTVLYVADGDKRGGVPPTAVARWFYDSVGGAPEQGCWALPSDDEEMFIPSLNDNGMTFDQLADLLEATYAPKGEAS